MTKRPEHNADAKTGTKGVESRRNFLKATTIAGSAAAFGSIASPFVSRAEAQELTPRQVPLAGMATLVRSQADAESTHVSFRSRISRSPK